MSSGSLFSWVPMEDRIPACCPLQHCPLQHVRKLWWDGSLMGSIRPSVSSVLPKAREQLLRVLLQQLLYGICTEWLLQKQLHGNLLSRWCVGLGPMI